MWQKIRTFFLHDAVFQPTVAKGELPLNMNRSAFYPKGVSPHSPGLRAKRPTLGRQRLNDYPERVALVSDALLHLRKTIQRGSWGYHSNGPQSAEPVAFASLAICANDLAAEALPLANWLAEIQTSQGSVGVTREQATPAWPTGLAMLAWQASEDASGNKRYAAAKRQALGWALQEHGKALPQMRHMGHDTTLVGWSWAAATHSWLEPTCFFVLALKALGKGDHPRTREGVRLIIDRQLEQGGCNFGNTRVLGQPTLPHVQPTGLAMLAIANEPSVDSRIERSLDFLESELNETCATASLCFALLGLTAHRRRPDNAEELIQHALKRELRNSPSCYKLALLSLASQVDTRWLPGHKFQAQASESELTST